MSTDSWLLVVWAVVAVMLAVSVGYCSDDKIDKHGQIEVKGEAIICLFWPVGLCFAILLSPIWVPMAAAELGGFLRRRAEAKEAVRRVLGVGGKYE